MSTYSTSPSLAKTKGDRPSSTSSDDPGVKQSPAKPDKPEKKERSGRKESKKDKSKTAVPPVEASQPPPGPLVPLGRPKERVLKRPRSVTLSPDWLIKTDPSSSFPFSLASFFCPPSILHLSFLPPFLPSPLANFILCILEDGSSWVSGFLLHVHTLVGSDRCLTRVPNFPVLYSVSYVPAFRRTSAYTC